MTEFTHSIVLFSADDGLPLEFNVRNTNDKSNLKAMIEHGGGLCTQSDNAVHLISPGTKVLNADMGKKLVSSRYILDCVKENYLLEVNDYVFVISEAQTSDISDEDSGRGKESPDILHEKQTIVNSDLNIDISTADKILNRNESSLTTPSKLDSQQKSGVSSNQSESFVEGSQDVSHNPRITARLDLQTCEFIPLTSTAKEPDSMVPDVYEDIEQQLSPIQASASLMSPKKRTIVLSQYEKKSSPKKIGFTNKEVLSPTKACVSPKKRAIVSPICEKTVSPKKVGFTNKFILSPIRASASHVSPKNKEIFGPTKASALRVSSNKGTIASPQNEKTFSPKKVAFTNKKLISPNRASLNVQQNETLYQSEDSSDDIFEKDDDVDDPKDPVRNEFSFQMNPIQSRGPTFNASPQKRSHTFPHFEQMEEDSEDESLIPNVPEPSVPASPAHAAVSSSQPMIGDLDQFDNLLLSKAQQKTPSDDEDHLSQSYTVSSSADAQKPNSAEVNSAEMFHAGPSSQLPDSPTHLEDQLNDKNLYIQRLEAKVEEILRKPSPKSIQDKIELVKYVCCIKKLSPAAVLQSLQQL